MRRLASLIRRRHRRAAVERLEERALLATFTVTSLADNRANDGQMTLREAVDAAEADPGSDAIVFQPGLTGVISLELGVLNITDDLTIIGLGQSDTVIDARGLSPLFKVSSSDFFVSGMTLQNAVGTGAIKSSGSFQSLDATNVLFLRNSRGIDARSGAGPQIEVSNSRFEANTDSAIYVKDHLNLIVEDSQFEQNRGRTGGAIYYEGDFETNHPELTIRRSEFVGNDALQDGGAIGGLSLDRDSLIEDSLFDGNTAYEGGAISVDNSLRVVRSTLRNNVATSTGGGMIAENRPEFVNSTLYGNSAPHGGAIAAAGVNVINSTISNNTATISGGGILLVESSSGSAFITSSIVAGNTLSDLDIGPKSATMSNSLLGANTASGLTATGGTPDADGNLIGTAAAPIDPMLLPPGRYDGLTPVMPLKSTSPAVDRGSNPRSLTTDQRGQARVQGEAADMGAVEGTYEGVLTIDNPAVTEGDSGTTALVFNVTLHGTSALPLTFDVNTVDGTAIAGSDYITAGESLSFAGTGGETQQVIVLVNGDTDVESNETLMLSIDNLNSLSVGTAGLGIGTITDDDRPLIHLDGMHLLVTGTDQNDDILIELVDDNVHVEVNAESADFTPTDIAFVRVAAGGGDDSVVTRFLAVPMEVDGGDGNDTLKSGLGNDTVFGGPGSDLLRGTKGNDRLFGGADADTLLGQLGNDFLAGNEGDDKLVGADGADDLDGGAGGDTLEGGPGKDELTGDGVIPDAQHGADRLEGGDDQDVLNGEGGDDTLLAGEGNDAGVRNTLNGGAGNDRLIGGRGKEMMSGGPGDDLMTGGAANDTLSGNQGNDTLRGGSGNDFVYGDTVNDLSHSGNDVLTAGSGADTLRGGPGDDHMDGGRHNDELTGGSGSDTLFGSGGHDILDGDNGVVIIGGPYEGNDVLYGNAGRDILYGGALADSLFGGSGEDLIISGEIAGSNKPRFPGGFQAEWLSNRGYDQRAINIRNGGGRSPDRLNRDNQGEAQVLIGANRNNQNVFDDETVDFVRGGKGLDFFFVSLGTANDDDTDRSPAERLDKI